jgi:hypothetical protein
VGDPELVEPRRSVLQLVTITAREGDVVQAGLELAELVAGALGMGMQAEQLAPTDDVDRVVEATDLLVLVEDWGRVEQCVVPPRAPLQVGDRHGDVGQCRKLRHENLRVDDRSNRDVLRRRLLAGADRVVRASSTTPRPTVDLYG